jgi:hypothetical protein
MSKIKKEKMVRMNSNIRPDQYKFVKETAKKMKMHDGELHRAIIDFYIQNYKPEQK